MLELHVAREWSDIPGGRWISDGPHSAEDFCRRVLIPRLKQARSEGERLVVNLDGSWGYPASWLHQVAVCVTGFLAFAEKEPIPPSVLTWKSGDNPDVVPDIEKLCREEWALVELYELATHPTHDWW